MHVAEAGDVGFQHGFQFVVQALGELVGLILCCLQCTNYIGAYTEKPFGERHCLDGLAFLGIGAKVFEVSAPVEDVEFLFILAHAEYVGTEAGSATYHLHKLDTRAHTFEENEVKHVGHVDAGVEHIY